MRRTLAAAVLLALATSGSLPAAAAGPKFLLTVKALKDEVRLGETIPLEITLRSGSPKAAAVSPFEIGSPRGLVFYLKGEDGVRHQVCRLRGRYDGQTFKEDVLPTKELKGGGRMEAKGEILAILTGKFEITTVFLGVDRRLQAEPLEAKPVTVTVLPGKDGETRVGARIRTGKGAMTVEFEPTKAYNTVHNFLTLARDGFYNKRVFHRIIKDFMVQTGCPKGDGQGDPGYFIPAEFNDVKHAKGVLSMARRGGVNNSAGSQFFIMHAENKGLDGQYTAFGRVVDGLEVVDALAAVPTQRGSDGNMSDPLEKPTLDSVDMVLLK